MTRSGFYLVALGAANGLILALAGASTYALIGSSFLIALGVIVGRNWDR